MPTILWRQSDGGGGGGGPPRRPPQRRGGRPVRVGRLVLFYVAGALALLAIFWGLMQIAGG
ncbi:MAG TPA: hypothetical protein VEB64_10400 [Azospirillaceae bacterium]|nr:hypothetical protein [Azospirillaceae bacterium]